MEVTFSHALQRSNHRRVSSSFIRKKICMCTILH